VTPARGAWGAVLLGVVLALASPVAAQAQAADRNAEARVYFERGNRHLDLAMRSRGAQRTHLLEEALRSYADSLRIVRSRNVVFNAALAFEELGRLQEAFAYYTEYLTASDLTDDERVLAEQRRGALRERVAVVRVQSEPPGAEVFVDRLDLAARGRTPLELALDPGEHTLHLALDDHYPAQAQVAALRGETTQVAVVLDALPPPEPPETTKPDEAAELAEPAPAEPAVVPLLPPPPSTPARRFGRAPGVLGGITLGMALLTGGLMARAAGHAGRFDDFRDAHCPGSPPTCDTPENRERLQALDRELHKANVVADVFLWTTVGLGLTTILLALLNRKREAPEPRVAASFGPLRGGGYLGASFLLGRVP
jgi:hypothetical protein